MNYKTSLPWFVNKHIDHLQENYYPRILCPSAGTGSYPSLIVNRLTYDTLHINEIDSTHNPVLKQYSNDVTNEDIRTTSLGLFDLVIDGLPISVFENNKFILNDVLINCMKHVRIGGELCVTVHTKFFTSARFKKSRDILNDMFEYVIIENDNYAKQPANVPLVLKKYNEQYHRAICGVRVK